MLKKIITLFAFCIPIVMQAQITISVQLPPAGMIQKDQLWNLVLVNNGNTAIEANILLNLQDALTGQSVLSAASRGILLSKGVKMLNIQDVQPVQYNYGTAIMSNNYLPPGSYIACYSVSRNISDRTEVLADECVRVNINPLSPPLLNSPADKSVLNNIYPQLTWIPPAPLDMFDNISYDVAVAEVSEGQSAIEAIMYNTPAYIKNHINTTYDNYPSSYSKLEAGKTYAWQVTARNGQSFAAATEVWTFSIAKDSVKTGIAYSSYILLKSMNGERGINYVSGNDLNIKYYSFDKEHEAAFRFLNSEGKLLQEKKQKIIYGDNFFNFKIGNSFSKRQIYFIEFTDQQNNRHTASFSIN